jgi:hypothetical protein
VLDASLVLIFRSLNANFDFEREQLDAIYGKDYELPDGQILRIVCVVIVEFFFALTCSKMKFLVSQNVFFNQAMLELYVCVLIPALVAFHAEWNRT